MNRPSTDDMSYDGPETGADLRQALDASPKPDFQYGVDPQADRFARCCVLYADMAQAYLMAGYPEQPTRAQTLRKATDLRAAPGVDERVAYYAAVQAARLDIRDERITAEMAAIAFSDPADFYNRDGSAIENIHDIPRHARAAVRTIHRTSRTTVDIEGNTTTTVDSNLQLLDKGKALDNLARVKGMIKDPKSGASQQPVVIIDMTGHDKGNTDIDELL